MVDWNSSMTQTYEYYIVDPDTWKDKDQLRSVTACTIKRDSDSKTLGSATFNVSEYIGECYIRAYLVTIQNGITEKHPLGTYLVQTPGLSFDGRMQSVSVDAYSPLHELNENPTPIGYSILKGENIMSIAYRLCRERMRPPVIEAENDTTLFYDFVSNTDDTWLEFLTDLIANAKYLFDLDELGRVLFSPKQDTSSLQPVWTYDDSNISILYPDISVDRDLYGIPNVVEVLYSTGGGYYYAKVVNDDSNSPISTVSRGREITKRITNPDLAGDATQDQIQEYAENLLRELSSLECTLSYKHGYCPVRVGDCVRINYERAGLVDIKAKVISQSIKCEPGCPVTEKAVFTYKLWKG